MNFTLKGITTSMWNQETKVQKKVDHGHILSQKSFQNSEVLVLGAVGIEKASLGIGP